MFGFGKSSNEEPSSTDAIALLKTDHRTVEALFAEFEDEQSKPRKITLATRICRELAVHAKVEEELVYPRALSIFGKDEQGLIWEATVEHGTLSGLIDALGGAAATDEDFDAHVKVLKEYVKHHVREEENEIFPRLRATGLDLEALGEEIADRKDELMERFDGPGQRRAA
jgi:hemerythrin superfamily protein